MVKPASYESLYDRPLGGRDKENECPHLFGNIAYALVGALCKICFRYNVVGRENLRAFKGRHGVMLVGTHTSYLDVVFYYLAARPSQWARIMGRDTLFTNGNGVGGWMLARLGAFPVKRDSADRTSVKRAVRMLKNDEVVLVLPEGTRRGKGSQIPEIHAGAALIARMANAPMMPCSVKNVELIKKKGERIRFPKVTLSYGTPIVLSDFDFLQKDERLEAAVWFTLRECFALSRGCDPDDVDMVALFPNGTDYTQVFRDHPIPKRTPEDVIAMLAASKRGGQKAGADKADADASEEKSAG